MSTAMTPAAQDAVPALNSTAAPRVLEHLYQMSVDEYERLADAEFLKDGWRAPCPRRSSSSACC